MKRIFLLGIIFCLSNIILTGCGKKLTDQVTQDETRVKVGSNVNLSDLFTCEEGIAIGFNNADSFDSNKIGSYSLAATITDGDEEAEKTYIVEVYDDEAPKIVVENENIVIYENDNFEPDKFVSCSDNSGETIDVNVDTSAVDISKAGEYEVSYSASDSSGNTANATMKVTVKKAFTYKKLKALVDTLFKENKYTMLKYKVYKSDKNIAISLAKILSPTVKEEYSFCDYIAIVLSVKDKKIVPQIYTYVGEQDTSKYLSPELMCIESKNGAIKSDNYSSSYDYDFGYNFEYSSNLNFLFKKLESLEKFCDIVKDDNVTLTAYTDKRTLKHKCTKTELKRMRQLGAFYEEILKYM